MLHVFRKIDTAQRQTPASYILIYTLPEDYKVHACIYLIDTESLIDGFLCSMKFSFGAI